MPAHNSQAAAWLKARYGEGDISSYVARAYRAAFSGKTGDAVLTDLQQALFVIDTTAERTKTGAVDPIAMAIAEGRRQAYLHIAGILQLTNADMAKQEKEEHDHRDERRGSSTRYEPRYPGGQSIELDGIEPASGYTADEPNA